MKQTVVYSPDRSTDRYFFDTEFIEDGKTIDLISIGVVCSDGRDFYRVSEDANLDLASLWVRENVLPFLPEKGSVSWSSRELIAEALRRFVRPRKGRSIEFWAYYADYDWVALCQLFGTMMDLPEYFPRFCMDLKQLSVLVGSPRHPKREAGEHDALEDARWNAELFGFLRSVPAS